MINASILPTALVLAMTFAAPGALAEGAAQPINPRTAVPPVTEGAYPASPAERQAAQQAKLTLAQAIAAAERAGNGPVIDAYLDIGNGAPAYRVRQLQGHDRIAITWVDAKTGAVTPGGMLMRRNWAREDFSKVARLDHTRLTATQAIAMATRREPGRAVSVGLEDSTRGRPFDVDVLNRGQIEPMTVGAQPVT